MSGEESQPIPVLDADGALEVLRTARRIAIVGASTERWRASNVVMAYLLEQGYECVPINPNHGSVLGRVCFPSLEAAVGSADPGARSESARSGAQVKSADSGARSESARSGAQVKSAVGQAFDIVDVFRRPEYTPEVARSAVATGCGTLWLQQRIVNWETARIAHEGGLEVVMDRCTAVDHRRLRERGGRG